MYHSDASIRTQSFLSNTTAPVSVKLIQPAQVCNCSCNRVASYSNSHLTLFQFIHLLPWGYSSIFLVLTSASSDVQVHVLLLANHRDELSTLKWHPARGWFMQHTCNTASTFEADVQCTWCAIKKINADGHLRASALLFLVTLLFLTLYCKSSHTERPPCHTLAMMKHI